MKNKLIELTKKLVAFKTVTGRFKEIEKAFGYIKKYLDGLYIKEYESGGFKSLVISNMPQKRQIFDLILHGHIDVVPASSEDEYTARVVNNKIYGRGALDMKGGLACLIYLMKKYVNSPRKLLLLITSDEEVGGTNGTQYLLNTLKLKGNFFITAEGEKKFYLKTEQKGVFMFKLMAQGIGEHSAYTWKGANAIHKLYEVYKNIEKLFPHNIKDKKHWYSTINLGTIKGGLTRSSIPDYAEAELDIRYCGKHVNNNSIESLIKTAIRPYREVTYQELYSTPLMKTDIRNPLLRKLNTISKYILHKKNDLYFQNHGTNDARFAADADIPAVGFGPVGDNYHAKNEYVSVESLELYSKILDQFIKKM
jgi:succinyl-diaminopimelate desuccinylase